MLLGSISSFLNNFPTRTMEIPVLFYKKSEPESKLENYPQSKLEKSSPGPVIKMLDKENIFLSTSSMNGGTLQIGIYLHDWEQIEQEVSSRATSYSVYLRS